MKKIIMFILLGFFCFTSCVRQVNITDNEKKYILLPEDIECLILSDYEIKTLKNGKEYVFTKSESKKNGYYSMYSTILTNEAGKEIKIKTIANVLINNEKAKSLYKSSIRTLKASYKSSIYDIDLKAFDVDQAFWINSEDFYSLTLRKGNFFYEVSIEGIKVQDNKINENIKLKFRQLIKTFKEMY